MIRPRPATNTKTAPDRLSRLMKIAKVRRSGMVIIGKSTEETKLSVRERMASHLMLHYFCGAVIAREDTDAALDTIATTIGATTEDAKKLLALISSLFAAPAPVSDKTREKINNAIIVVLTELSDLATMFVKQKSYKDEYTEIAAAITGVLETTNKFIPPNEEWTATPRAPPIENQDD